MRKVEVRVIARVRVELGCGYDIRFRVELGRGHEVKTVPLYQGVNPYSLPTL